MGLARTSQKLHHAAKLSKKKKSPNYVTLDLCGTRYRKTNGKFDWVKVMRW